MRPRRIAVIPGDGIGPEIIPEALRALEALEDSCDLTFEVTTVDIGARHFARTGVGIPDDAMRILEDADAILKGPVGLPSVRLADGTEFDVGLPIRFKLDLYANVRPVTLLDGVESILKNKRPNQIDYTIVRENTEGLYAANQGGTILRDETAVDPLIMTKEGVKRVTRVAFTLSRNSRGAPADGIKRVTCVDKSNVLRSFAFFRSKFNEVGQDFPDIEKDYAYADALTQRMLLSPEKLNIVVAENFIGDILSDLGAATVGGLGLLGSANLGDKSAMFEAVHGSAPDIAGRAIANPIGILFACSYMLDWLHESSASDVLKRAIARVVRSGKVRTVDLGGTSSTKEMGESVAKAVKEIGTE